MINVDSDKAGSGEVCGFPVLVLVLCTEGEPLIDEIGELLLGDINVLERVRELGELLFFSRFVNDVSVNRDFHAQPFRVPYKRNRRREPVVRQVIG